MNMKVSVILSTVFSFAFMLGFNFHKFVDVFEIDKPKLFELNKCILGYNI